MVVVTWVRALPRKTNLVGCSHFIGRRTLLHGRRFLADCPPHAVGPGVENSKTKEKFGENTVYTKFREDEMALLTDNASNIPLLETILRCPFRADLLTKLSRKDKERLRYVAGIFESSKLPSVTRVLQATASPQNQIILNKWKRKKVNELGEEGFAHYMSCLSSDGGSFHKSIESYFNQMPVELENSGQWKSIYKVLQDVDGVQGLELYVSHPLLSYLGRLDCVGLYKNKLCIIDWKLSSAKKETLKQCYDDPYQIAAYVGAFNVSTDVSNQVTSAVIVKAYRDGTPADVHYLNEFVLDFYWEGWLRRLARHHIHLCNSERSTQQSNSWTGYDSETTSV